MSLQISSSYKHVCEIEYTSDLYDPVVNYAVKKWKPNKFTVKDCKYLSKGKKNIKIDIQFDLADEIVYANMGNDVIAIEKKIIGNPAATADFIERLAIVTLSSDNRDAIYKFIETAVNQEQLSNMINRSYINVYIFDGHYWPMVNSREKRSIDTIYFYHTNIEQ